MSTIGANILGEGVYTVADDCTLYHAGKRTIKVVPKKKKGHYLKETDKRCRDCKYRVMGLSSNTNHTETFICLQQPKGRRPTNIFYHAPAYGKVCEFFKEVKK